MNILIVDDDPEILETISSMVKNIVKPENLKTFEDPNLALNEILSGDYDLVISDFYMPDLNGVDILKKVFEEKKPNVPKFIFNSGQPDELKIDSELGLYVLGVFSKLSDITGFISTVSSFKNNS